MPHYPNGEQAYVGDGVVGVGYNEKKIKVGSLANAPAAILVGRITSITPGAASCNCQIVAVEVSEGSPVEGDRPLTDILGQRFTIQDAQGKPVVVRIVHDYSDCGQFAPVHTVMSEAKGRGVKQLLEGLQPVEQRHLDAYEQGMEAEGEE